MAHLVYENIITNSDNDWDEVESDCLQGILNSPASCMYPLSLFMSLEKVATGKCMQWQT